MGSSALLLTGRPGIGKTTAIARAAERLAHLRPRGFLTRELREGGRRVGFELRTLAGARATLAHVDLDTAERVGRYGVDVDALERVVVPELTVDPPTRLVLIDEIGKMECFSGRFVAAVRALLDARRPLVATVASRPPTENVTPAAEARSTSRTEVATPRPAPISGASRSARLSRVIGLCGVIASVLSAAEVIFVVGAAV